MPPSISTYTVYSFNANLILIIALERVERGTLSNVTHKRVLKSLSSAEWTIVNRCPDSSCDWEWFRCCAESARSATAYSSSASSCSPPQCTSCRSPPPASQPPSPPPPSPPPESPVSGLQAEQTNPHTGFIGQTSEGRREEARLGS